MKTILAIAFLIMTSVATAQVPKEKGVGDFNELKVYDLIEVRLVHSDDNRVEITGEYIEDVVVVNKNGKLKIRMELDKTFNGDKTFVTVHYSKLDIIDGNEGAIIESDELITQDSIELKVQEGSRIDVGLEVDNVTIRAISGGGVHTKGKAKSQDITINTGGSYDGQSFDTESTTVRIKAAGRADVKASKLVDAKVLAGGNVYVYGNPETIKENTTFGGRIKRMN